MEQEMSGLAISREAIELTGGILVLLVASYRLYRWAMWNRLWPNREKWRAGCLRPKPHEPYYDDDQLDEKRAFTATGIRWCQMRKMRKGDYYELNLAKTRIVKEIEFVDNGQGYPEQYRLLISETDSRNWVSKEIRSGPIRKIFDKPTKIHFLRIEIVKPRILWRIRQRFPAWSIYDIKITEVRASLWGHCWTAVILE